MDTQYLVPLQAAWERARGLLFDPFDIRVWLTLGLTAWLARLWDGSISGGDGGLKWDLEGRGDGVLSLAVEKIIYAVENPLGVFVIVMLMLVFLVVAAAVAWLSSRGAFLFLDNVAHRRARVSEPWDRLGRLGDSLFVWRVATQILAGLLAFALMIPLVVLVAPAVDAGGIFMGIGLALAIPLGMVGLLLGVVVAFVGFCTDQFVVPLMHRYDEGVLPAWERFLPLLRREPLSFLLMAVLYLVLAVAVSVFVAAAGLMTCCALFLVLAIPYVGTVILLPVHATARAFGPEFLGQFGEQYRVWPEPERIAPPAEGPPTSPEGE